MELNGGCNNLFTKMKMKKHLASFFIILLVLLIIVIIYFLYKRYHKKERYRTPNNLLQYPNFLTT